MEKKKFRFSRKIFAFIGCVAFLFLSIFFFIELSIISASNSNTKSNEDDLRSYHVIITGTYENQLFMQQVYEGAQKFAELYSAVIELYVPESQASNLSLQNLLDYCVYVNADGIIAFIDSPDEQIKILQRSQGNEIPLITTGQFAPEVHQVSFIGSGYWELGKKIADETLSFLKDSGQVYIINDYLSTNANYNTLINSMQTALLPYTDINIQMLSNFNQNLIKNSENLIKNSNSLIKNSENLIKSSQNLIKNSQNFTLTNEKNLFICLTEDETIKAAQLLREKFPNEQYDLIGFGSNEACQIYLEKGIISELISLDPQKIGEAAIKELFEYRNKGYANSYISADVKISRNINNKTNEALVQ